MVLTEILQVVVILVAASGFAISVYIWRKKRKHEVLVCPLNADCETVIHSQFSTFLGVPVELWGMLYYGAVALGYTAFLLWPALYLPWLEFLWFSLTIAAFLFSLYLTFIQAVTLKEYCSWCLTSASLSTVIVGLVVFSVSGGITTFLATHQSLLLVGHTLGFVLGLGGATIADVLFFRFLRDFVISEKEAEVLGTLSQVVWLGLAIVVVTGVGLFLPQSAVLLVSSKFLVKMVVVAVIIINGAWLNLYVSPRLITLRFDDATTEARPAMRRLRRVAFALGAVSFTSWYTAFGLGFVRSIPLSFGVLLLIYLGGLVMAVGVSQVVGQRIMRQAR